MDYRKFLKILVVVLIALGAVFAVLSYFSARHVANILPKKHLAKRLNISDALNHINRHPGDVPVLMYHYIGDLPANSNQIRKDLTVSSEDFATEIDLLQKHGFNSITVDQLYNSFVNKTILPPNPIVITFDDGYENTFVNAVPILLKHNMLGTFAIITGSVGTPDYAGWDEIAAAHIHGMEIVSHTVNHIDFTDPKYSYSDKQYQIAQSKKDIQDRLGIDTKYFVYPYGHHDSATENILKDNGYVMAFTTGFGFDNKTQANYLEMPRVRVHGVESLQIFAELLGIDTTVASKAPVLSNP